MIPACRNAPLETKFCAALAKALIIIIWTTYSGHAARRVKVLWFVALENNQVSDIVFC